jgi:hypothetical protein
VQFGRPRIAGVVGVPDRPRCHRPGYLVSTGRFALRGIGRAQDLYTLDPVLASDQALAGSYERYLAS